MLKNRNYRQDAVSFLERSIHLAENRQWEAANAMAQIAQACTNIAALEATDNQPLETDEIAFVQAWKRFTGGQNAEIAQDNSSSAAQGEAE